MFACACVHVLVSVKAHVCSCSSMCVFAWACACVAHDMNITFKYYVFSQMCVCVLVRTRINTCANPLRAHVSCHNSRPEAGWSTAVEVKAPWKGRATLWIPSPWPFNARNAACTWSPCAWDHSVKHTGASQKNRRWGAANTQQFGSPVAWVQTAYSTGLPRAHCCPGRRFVNVCKHTLHLPGQSRCPACKVWHGAWVHHMHQVCSILIYQVDPRADLLDMQATPFIILYFVIPGISGHIQQRIYKAGAALWFAFGQPL